MIDDATRKLLDSQDWKTIVAELSDHALIKVRKLYWRRGKTELPKGKVVEDLVFDAISKTYSGERNWNPAVHPDLIKYLKSVIDSDTNHLVESFDHKRQDQSSNDCGDEDSKLDQVKSVEPIALSELIAEEQWKCLEEAAQLNNDDEMQLILMCLKDQITKRSDIADELRLPLDKTDNALKRIRRHMKKCQEK